MQTKIFSGSWLSSSRKEFTGRQDQRYMGKCHDNIVQSYSHCTFLIAHITKHAHAILLLMRTFKFSNEIIGKWSRKKCGQLFFFSLFHAGASLSDPFFHHYIFQTEKITPDKKKQEKNTQFVYAILDELFSYQINIYQVLFSLLSIFFTKFFLGIYFFVGRVSSYLTFEGVTWLSWVNRQETLKAKRMSCLFTLVSRECVCVFAFLDKHIYNFFSPSEESNINMSFILSHSFSKQSGRRKRKKWRHGISSTSLFYSTRQ